MFTHSLLFRISIMAHTCLPHAGDEMFGSVTKAGGYYACGANVASKACGKERQRVRQGILTGE